MYFKIARFFTILSLFAIPIVSKTTLFPFIVGKYSWFRASMGFALLAFLMGLLFSLEKNTYWERFKKVIKSPLGVAVTVFAVVFLLAGFLGFDPANSFWSNFERGEGGVQIINLWIFFILLTTLFTDESGWRKVLGYAVFAGFLSTLYGLLASFGLSDFIGSTFKDGEAYRFQGSVGNPSYVAVYSIFLVFYVAYLLGTAERKELRKHFIKNGALILGAAIFIVVFFLAATRGAFLGILASIFLLLVFVIFSSKRFRKTLGLLLFAGILVFGSLFYFKDTSFVKNLPGSRIFDVSFSATTFGHRAIMWKTALDGFKERPLLGWGPENFYQIFDRHFNTNYFNPPEAFGAWFDRAHSFIFDYLAETGILGLAAFLGVFATFYFVFFDRLIKSRRSGGHPFLFNSSLVRGLFFALPFAYFIQGMVLFDVLVTYMNFFFFLALANHHFIGQSVPEEKFLTSRGNRDESKS